MLKSFSTAATGMIGQQMMVDVIANNLANVNTTGFKRSQIDFQDLVYVSQKDPGTEVASGVYSPSGIEIGSGVRPGGTVKVYSTGELQNTGRDLDIAIEGDGFLKVLTPNGDTRYTRDGSLQTNASGQLVTSTGYPLEPAITIPTDTSSIHIGVDGSINVTNASGVRSVVGTLELATFPNPSGLASEGGNLLSETDASGSPVAGVPGQNGIGSIRSGFLEKSNVQMVNELVNLITAQRAYEINSKAITVGDEMLQATNNLVR